MRAGVSTRRVSRTGESVPAAYTKVSPLSLLLAGTSSICLLVGSLFGAALNSTPISRGGSLSSVKVRGREVLGARYAPLHS